MTTPNEGKLSRVTLAVTLRVQGPVLTRSSSIGAPGIDAPMAIGRVLNRSTDTEEFRFYLPGRLIKGLLREAWEELGTLSDTRYSEYAENWLGSGSRESKDEEKAEEGDVPERGRLTFGDFVDWQTESSEQSLRYRIKIDDASGAAGDGMFQVIDSPYSPFDTVEFRGEIRWLTANVADQEIVDAILRGLSWVRAVGGVRTSGFGQVLDVSDELDIKPLAASASLKTRYWNLRLRFSEPLIFSKRRISDNLFESDDILPGAALKGAVAEMIARDPAFFTELKDELHNVRFTHAFPATKSAPRPSQIPLSLFEFPKEGDINDVIAESGPPSPPNGHAGKFDIDWKDETRKGVNKLYRWPKVPTELRVRTAIDSSIRKTRESALFAWQMLVPHGFEWVSSVETSGLSPEASRQLECLIRFGIEPLGKTRSLAIAQVEDAEPRAVEAATAYAVVLQTPALLLNPEPLIESSIQSILEIEYQKAWTELSGNSLELGSYFQRCSLTGGKYFQKRFQFRHSVYAPYLLCDAGSAFLLKPVPGRESIALAHLHRWEERGLPLTATVRKFYEIPDEESLRWKHCPYVPENGYGEIAVNQGGPYQPFREG